MTTEKPPLPIVLKYAYVIIIGLFVIRLAFWGAAIIWRSFY